MIDLDDFDRSILRQCPMTIDTARAINIPMQAAKMKRIKRMWSAGLLGGSVGEDRRTLVVTIRDPGRLAIGRPAIEPPVTGDADAPAP